MDKIKALNIIKWIILLPISMLFAEMATGIVKKIIDYIEIYLFGKDFFQYHWSLFCVAVYGSIYGFFLSATSYTIAPNYKRRSSYIILVTVLFIEIFFTSDFSNKYFYISTILSIIIALITPGILEENKQKSFFSTILAFFGLLIIAIWLVGSLVLHFWTVKLIYHDYGSFFGFCSFFLPIISEIIYLFKLWNAHDGYVKLFFLVLFFYFFKYPVSIILSYFNNIS